MRTGTDISRRQYIENLLTENKQLREQLAAKDRMIGSLADTLTIARVQLAERGRTVERLSHEEIKKVLMDIFQKNWVDYYHRRYTSEFIDILIAALCRAGLVILEERRGENNANQR